MIFSSLCMTKKLSVKEREKQTAHTTIQPKTFKTDPCGPNPIK